MDTVVDLKKLRESYGLHRMVLSGGMPNVGQELRTPSGEKGKVSRLLRAPKSNLTVALVLSVPYYTRGFSQDGLERAGDTDHIIPVEVGPENGRAVQTARELILRAFDGDEKLACLARRDGILIRTEMLQSFDPIGHRFLQLGINGD